MQALKKKQAAPKSQFRGKRKSEIKNGSEISTETVDRLADFGRINLPLLIVLCVLIGFGLIMLFSESICLSYYATVDTDTAGTPLHYFKTQTVYMFIALAAALLIAAGMRISFFNRPIFILIAYLICTGLLLAVAVGGQGRYGADRWIKLFGIIFQPSEIAKFLLVYCLAGYYSHLEAAARRGFLERANYKASLKAEVKYYILIPAAAVGVWIILVVLQPHLSGAIIMILLTAAIVFTVKIPGRVWLASIPYLLIYLLVILILFGFYTVLIKHMSPSEYIAKNFAHAKNRLETFGNPDEVSKDKSYQVEQSLLALGSGGLFGVGLAEGRQKFNYLPMIYNDYLFSGMGEELGFVGSATVLIAFILFFIIGTKIALDSSNLFALIISWGYTFLITLQALLHIAVATNTIPATGISLPFFSYGGSSNMLFIIATGLILCVSRTGSREDRELFDLMKLGRQAERNISSLERRVEKAGDNEKR